ncbi:hypothetical protein B0H11DRAFT_2135841 [Mycena galericulata]|nr:hypothetical protein B0H11DRAFT_2135841 [Mycena galericulata]
MPRRDILVHPSNDLWRLRLHPTSRLLNRACVTHGGDCPDASTLELHHVQDSWTTDDREAHPVWTHDLVDLCPRSEHRHECDDLCRLFQGSMKSFNPTPNPTLLDEIAYFHASNDWDLHWESPPAFSLHSSLAHMLNPKQTDLIATHLRQIERYYAAMESAGFFAQTAAFIKTTFHAQDVDRPRYPTSAFGAGFSGFDRIDERGWDRAGYEYTEDEDGYEYTEVHSPANRELRTSYQIAYFVALGRILQIPAGHLVAYDPCYSMVDVVLLASLGVRAFRKDDPGRRALRKFSNPTLFYAPSAEQMVFTDAIQRAAPIENLVILGCDAAWYRDNTTVDTTDPVLLVPIENLVIHGGDATWHEDNMAIFGTDPVLLALAEDVLTDAWVAANYRCISTPEYITTPNGETPCGERNCLQWIPTSRVAAFEAARGPAREPGVRHIQMPDGSLEPDD